MASRPTLTRFAGLAFAASTFIVSNRAAVAQGASAQLVSLDLPSGRASATLQLPEKPARPVVVCVLTSDAGDLSAALAAGGIAALRLAATAPTADEVARWIAHLRNDGRFPTVTVVAEGEWLPAAVIAMRVARADGLIVRGDPNPAKPELDRVVAAKLTMAGRAESGDAAQISEFARGVAVFGRRGAPQVERPAQARRSPRQVLLTEAGAIRIGVEWGQPQKRGREIWGALVKWDARWMPGADEATTLSTNGPMTLGDLEIPAGDYTIYTMPGADRFELIISTDVGQFHTVFDASKVLGRVALTRVDRTQPVEGLTFEIDAQRSPGTFKLMWDTREYHAPLVVR